MKNFGWSWTKLVAANPVSVLLKWLYFKNYKMEWNDFLQTGRSQFTLKVDWKFFEWAWSIMAEGSLAMVL